MNSYGIYKSKNLSLPLLRNPFLRILLWLAVVCLTACSSNEPYKSLAKTGISLASERRAELLLVLVDLSDPIIDRDNTLRWRTQLESKLALIQEGDAIQMLAIGEDSSARAPLFEETIPKAEGDTSLLKRVAARKALQRVRCEALSAFERVLDAKNPERNTDLLGALARVSRTKATASISRDVVVAVFSDMLNATSELNLEPMRFSASLTPRLVNRVISKRGWNESTLQGARISCYLNSNSTKAKSRPSREGLEEFWRGVFKATGADVEHFENSNLKL